MNKWIVFALIVVIGTFLDLATKTWAENNLASEGEFMRMQAREAERDTPIGERLPFLYRQVSQEAGGRTLAEWQRMEFGRQAESADGARTLHTIHRVLDEGFDPQRGHVHPERTVRILPEEEVRAGEWLEIRHRQKTVVPGFWNHIYVRNPGAAWGMFAERPESFRRPFFIGVSLLSILLMIWIVRITHPKQRLLILALAVIVAGALGNLVDRIRYGYVVDFIQWYVTIGGTDRVWPTFNIADVWISVGVGLMFLEIVIGPSEEELKAADAEAQAGTGPDEAARQEG